MKPFCCNVFGCQICVTDSGILTKSDTGVVAHSPVAHSALVNPAHVPKLVFLHVQILTAVETATEFPQPNIVDLGLSRREKTRKDVVNYSDSQN